MKVLIDLTSLADNFSGIERFALSITKELLEDNTRVDIKYVLLFKNEVHKEFQKERTNVTKIVLKGSNKLFFNQIILPLELLKIKADYYFFPAFPAPFFFFSKNAISVIHDMGCWDCPVTNKKYMVWYFKLMYWKAALGKKKVVTVSEFSKMRIVEILGKNLEEVIVIYDGLSDNFANFSYNESLNQRTIDEYKLPEEYLLCLSTLEPRKNLRLLVKAYDDLLIEEKINIDLVLAGRKGWMMDDLLSNLSSKTVDRIHFTGFIEDELLPYVYKNAKLFVFPSLYEGFGIPPIEAMSMGVPVVSSDAASLPEVLGGAASYFINNDYEDLKEHLLRVLSLNKYEVIAIRKKGIEQASRYSWRKEAIKLRGVLFNI